MIEIGMGYIVAATSRKNAQDSQKELDSYRSIGTPEEIKEGLKAAITLCDRYEPIPLSFLSGRRLLLGNNRTVQVSDFSCDDKGTIVLSYT